jgi:hypothetical protein
MGIDEMARHDLFVRLEQVLGPAEATTLMEHLPPTGWADVATKRDLDQLAASLRKEIEVSEHRVLATMRADMTAQTRTMIHAMIFTTSSSVLTVAALAFAAARLA